MACDAWRQQLDAYLDGELQADSSAKLMEHLRGCSDCTALFVERVQMKRAVSHAGIRYRPSAEFRNKVTRSVASNFRSNLVPWWRFAAVSALAVMLIAASIVSVYTGRERAAQQRAYSEFADLHVATLASQTPVDVISTDRHTVKPWFQGRIPFTFNLPELSGTEFSLMGGRVFYLEQVSGAHLIYRIRQHEISVFILPQREGVMLRFPSGERNSLSFQTEAWTKNGLNYFVIGDASAGDIQTLSNLLHDAG